MKVVEIWKNIETGKIYQVRQYEEKEVWVDLGCGWFKSYYSLDYIQTKKILNKFNKQYPKPLRIVNIRRFERFFFYLEQCIVYCVKTFVRATQ